MTSHPKSHEHIHKYISQEQYYNENVYLVWTKSDVTAWQIFLPLAKEHHIPSMTAPYKTHMSEIPVCVTLSSCIPQ